MPGQNAQDLRIFPAAQIVTFVAKTSLQKAWIVRLILWVYSCNTTNKPKEMQVFAALLGW